MHFEHTWPVGIHDVFQMPWTHLSPIHSSKSQITPWKDDSIWRDHLTKCNGETVMGLYHLFTGNSYTGKTTTLYWNAALEEPTYKLPAKMLCKRRLLKSLEQPFIQHQISNTKSLFLAANLVLAGFPLTNANALGVAKACLLATKSCLTYAFVTQQPFGIPNWNLDTCIFVA